jgi:hypothetical protein
VRLLRTPGLGLYSRRLAQSWSTPKAHAGPNNANRGDTAAAMTAVQVARQLDLDSPATLATKDQSVHVWQTNGYACHSLGIANPFVDNYCKPEWLRRI